VDHAVSADRDDRGNPGGRVAQGLGEIAGEGLGGGRAERSGVVAAGPQDAHGALARVPAHEGGAVVDEQDLAA